MRGRRRQQGRIAADSLRDAPTNHVVFFVSEDWWFCLHWMNLAVRLRSIGYTVTVSCNVGSDRARIEAAGIGVLPLPLNRSGANILNDVSAIRMLVRWLRRERPALIHCVGIKPILIGTLAARCVGGIGVVNHFAGLGYLFSSSQIKAKVLRPAAMLGMRVIFAGCDVRLVTMNSTDRDVLGRWKLADADRIDVIPGTGIDVDQFPLLPVPKEGPPTVAIIARMIEDKGIAVLVEAFRRLRTRMPDAKLLLVGWRDERNPTVIPESQLRAWSNIPGITWLGYVEDVRDVWLHAHIAVLPSRREGLPVCLLEAAACGRPLVATDVPGCTDVVIPDHTGMTVPMDDPEALANALQTLGRSSSLQREYGRAARRLVEERYSIDIVGRHVAELYERVMKVRPAGAMRGLVARGR